MDVTGLTEDKGTVITTFDSFKNTSRSIRLRYFENLTAKAFPKKLNDLNGYKFNVGFFLRSEIRVFDDGTVKAPFLYFLDALKNIMNASYTLHMYPNYETDEFSYALSQRKIDVSLVETRPGKTNPEIFSFERGFYCIYAPRPERISLIQMMLIEPFEWKIWLTCAMTVIGTAIVWRLYKVGNEDEGLKDHKLPLVSSILNLNLFL